jgi:TetR/AcrR family transcriptional repressor of nem operon
MKPNSKQKILEAGAEIIHRKGFNHAGLQEILKAANVPKGSFYNHFKSKVDFGLQVIDFFADVFAQHSKAIFEDRLLSPLKRLERILDYYIEYFKENHYTCGCPVGNLAQEMGDLSEVFQKRLDRAIDLMAEEYAGLLTEAQICGEIPGNMDVKEAAYFIIAGWHGALIRMKVTRNDNPLINHKNFVLRHVLKS